MRAQRVLHLIHHLRYGGSETLLSELLPLLAEAGFEVHVCCLDDRGPLFDVLRRRGITAHFIGRRRGFDGAALARLRALVRGLRPDLLNTHSFSAGFWGRMAVVAMRNRPRVVTTVHTVAGWLQPLKQRFFNRLMRPWTDRIVAVSNAVRASLLSQGVPGELVSVIHNGINPERFRALPDRAEVRAEMGFPPEAFVAGMVARCSAEKGGDQWLRALALLDAEGREPRGLLVGDGPELESWKKLAFALGIGGRVDFAGGRADVPRLMAAMDALVCPSLQESFGLVALEGQAAGLPVVATTAEGFTEVLHDGEDALLVPPADCAALFAAMRGLRQSPGLAGRLAAAGRRNAARFPVAETARRYAGLYRELLPNRTNC